MTTVDEFIVATRLRDWALRGLSREETLLVSFARTSCLRAIHDAEKDQREFTPIHWFYVDVQTPPIMTLWDMNDPQKR